MERREGPTPSGGAYSEAHYLNDEGKEVPIEEATRIIINEYTDEGTVIETTHGSLKTTEQASQPASQNGQ